MKKTKEKKGWVVSILIENDGKETSCSADLPVPFDENMAKEVMECVKSIIE